MQPISYTNLNPEQKAARFLEIRKETIEGIRRDHERFTYKVYGWCRNKFRSVFGMSSAGQAVAVAKAVAKLALLPFQIPVLTPALNKLATEGLEALEKSELALRLGPNAHGDEMIKASGDWLVVRGAEAFRDAVRKIDDSANAFNHQDPSHFRHCDDYCEWVKNFYYWRYRLDRLKYYKSMLQRYMDGVDGKLKEAEQAWVQAEAKMQQEGPKIFDDYHWHLEHCHMRETCVFPWHIKKAPPPPASPPPMRRV